MIRMVIESSDSIKTIIEEKNPNEKNVINPKISSIEDLYNNLPFSSLAKNTKRNLLIFLQNFSEERKLDEIFFEKLSENEKVLLSNLFDFEISKEKSFKKTFFFLDRGFKKLHKKILKKNFHNKNLNGVRKCFIKINEKIYSDFILDQNRNNLENENKKKFLNFFFDFPNEELKEIILYSLKEFKKTNSSLIFCFKKYKNEFFKNLFLFKKQKWRFFRKNINFLSIKENRDILSQCILVDYVISYFMKLFY